MRIGTLLVFVPFILGLFISQAISNDVRLEIPFSDNHEAASPYDRIKESQIFVYGDRVVLQVKDASLAEYADTNSMDPLLDIGANGLEVKPRNEDDLHIGDVIAYETDIGLIAHRIVDIDHDKNGRYFVLKGDNNNENDPYKVRFDQIKYVLIGVIY